MRYFYFQLLLILFTANFSKLNSQENYVNGYIFKNNGDTLTGFISYTGRAFTPMVISFKISENDKATEYKPSQIKGFLAKEDRYVSVFSEVSANASGIEKIENDPGINTKADSIFLEILIQGDKSLFYNKSPEGSENFYILFNNNYQLLNYKKYYRINNGVKIIAENNLFLGQLGAYMNDCTKIQNYLHGVIYTKASLRILFLKYYDCTPSGLIYIKENNQVFSNENFIEGYIIDEHRDTVKGWIDYRNWNSNPSKIKFRETGKISTVLSPSGILEFGVNNEKYVSAMAETEVSPVKLNELQKNPKLNIRISRLFLQVLIDGEKPLYAYKSSDGKENFYIKQDSSLQLLTYKKYLKATSNADIVVENKSFTGQLNVYLTNCVDIQKKIAKLSYTCESLKRLFQEYYACINKDIYVENVEKTILEKGVLAGVSVTNLKFNGSDYNSLNTTVFPSSAFFTAGVFLNAIFPKNKKRICLANELIFTYSGFRGESEEFDYAQQNIRTLTDINLPVIKLNNLLRYKFREGNSFFYLNIGLGNGFSFGSTIKQKEEYMNSVKEWQIEHSKYEMSFIAGGGFGYGKYNLDIRIEKGSGFSFIPNLDSKLSRIYVLLGYKF